MEGYLQYDWKGSSSWTEYLGRIEVPVARDAKEQREVLEKLKRKWYKKNVDKDFEYKGKETEEEKAPAVEQKEEKKKKTTTKTSPSSSGKEKDTKQQKTSTNSSGGSMWSSLLKSLVSVDMKQTLLFVGHLTIILCAIAYVVPFLGFNFSFFCYRCCLQSVVGTSLMKLHTKYGLPPLRPLSLDALTRWFQPVQMSTDFHYLFMALSVLRHPPLTIILAPPVCLAVYHAAAFANSTRIARTNLLGKKVMQPAYNALRNAQREALIFNAAAEVMAFFQIIFRLFTKLRSIMLVFMFFNMLKMRYNSPDSQAYHKYVWSQIDARVVQPYLLRFVPQLHQPIEMVKRLFTVQQQQQRTE